MRITAVETRGVGGLTDGLVDLPDGPVTAFAGGNGTGKSKLLACILSLWSHTIPTPPVDGEAHVTVFVALDDQERAKLAEFSVDIGWGPVTIPAAVSVTTKWHPTAGVQRSSEPNYPVLAHAWGQEQFLRSQPSLDVIYLPAERRLLPANQTGIDLNQLSDVVAWQKTAESRSAVQNYGRLDDQEFEQFAKALFVASTLPDEPGEDSDAERALSRADWESFKETVNALIEPKVLLPLSRQHPDQLRIQTPARLTHGVPELSSGERQALIIISRVLRAGAGHTLVMIDEPDAYLHPHLSSRLVQALTQGVGSEGQLIVATHSPAVLDSLTPSAILRLSHENPPQVVAGEAERVDLYRSAGFRASALTQSDLLLVVEGEGDGPLLSLLFPELNRASIREAGGRQRVFREVEQLSPYEFPVLGAVDRDVAAPPPPALIEDKITVWPAGDIEAVFLSDDGVLALMIELGLIKPALASLSQLRTLLDQLIAEQKDNVIAELAQNQLRTEAGWAWPTPKGERPIDRLRESVASFKPIGNQQVEHAIARAQEIWEGHASNPWPLIRGKILARVLAERASEMRSGRALLETVARQRPTLAAMQDFKQQVTHALGQS